MKMKKKLMILSLSPLAFLTIIRNFSFTTVDSQGVTLSICEFLLANIILLIVMVCCILWLAVSMGIFVEFNAFKWADKKSGYEVNEQIVIATLKDVTELLKMMDDDILRSDLTGQEYNSTAKQILDPIPVPEQ